MSSASTSPPSTPRLELPSTPGSPLTPTRRRHAPAEPDPSGPTGQDVLLFLVASRVLNALIIQTFFQPDEYFQALEPAWALAFGNEGDESGGAWITWEWREQLRSALHPSLFAVCYVVADRLAGMLSLSGPYRSQLLLAAPKLLQAVIAALGDYYTWRLAESTYGIRSLAPAAALVLTVANPWQWFCSTRTFSNSLETTLTIVALYNWPWHWSTGPGSRDVEGVDQQGLRVRKMVSASYGVVDETTRLRRALLAAAFAVVLRPTNVLVWATLVVLMGLRSLRQEGQGTNKKTDEPQKPLRCGPTQRELLVSFREVLLCGSAVLCLSAVVDRLFYQTWTFPAWHFLQVNLFQSIAGFYGNNNWHYYLSQGYPLLLTTALPFALLGMYQSCFGDRYRNLSSTARFTLRSLTITSLVLAGVLSLISHKEVRFIYPLLPGLHILAAHPTAAFFASAFDSLRPYSQRSQLTKRLLLAFLLLTNLSISLYTASIHNSGLINITHHLRSDFETYHLPHPVAHNMTVGFLMPCHSTPWRSHLQYPPTNSSPGIDAWALTCEPPLGLSSAIEKRDYVDEADRFYLDPATWLQQRMSRSPPATRFLPAQRNEAGVIVGPAKPNKVINIKNRSDLETGWRTKPGSRRPWPEYLIFFSQLEPQMKQLVGRASGYTECKRVWNSHWHEDWRRRGEIVVWCLFPERRDMMMGGSVVNKKVLEDRIRDPRPIVNGGAEKVLRVAGEDRSSWKQRPLTGTVKQSRTAGAGQWWEWAKSQVGLGERRRAWYEGWLGRRGRGGGHWD
ncbi:GPI mannosyltransferase 3 [Cyphellophora attinorum]|uniref:Mannosyltransferase n=1 Tax=Cyphellophora attinorum TaxID=1664694 RepID=A0A0N1I175_9EURO|nr:GPI mannosyltransferase 3 [Phialophora attinorum]KPI45516.1 GPI mannosyltransferase 3 [Phialophora attinorum]